jgi:hypothetical protein
MITITNDVKNTSVIKFIKQNLDKVMNKIIDISGGDEASKTYYKMVKDNPELISGDENLVQFKDQDEEKKLYDIFQLAFDKNKITDGGFKSKIIVDGITLFVTV